MARASESTEVLRTTLDSPTAGEAGGPHILAATPRAPPPRSVALLPDRDVPRLGRDPREPGADRGIPREIETALAGDVGVGVQRDVCDRVALPDEKAPLLEVPLHRVEGSVPRGVFRRERHGVDGPFV